MKVTAQLQGKDKKRDEVGGWTRGGGFSIFDAETMPETKRFLETATEEDVELVRGMIREEGEKGLDGTPCVRQQKRLISSH